MKKLLNFGAVGLLTGALLDPLIYGGIGAPVPWVRDVAMAAGGVLCIGLLVKYRREL